MTNRNLQDRILDLLESGFTVLAETERFVHQIQRKFRQRRLAAGNIAWESPRIFTLNRWMDSFWSQTWPEDRPASAFERWRILKECLEFSPPPEPILADVGLIHLLDESFDSLLRYGMDPGRGETANRLIEWRRELWVHFRRGLEDASLFHPAQLPGKILQTLGRGPATPGKMAFVGFEFAGHLERELLGTLEHVSRTEFLPLPMGRAQPEALSFSDPDQELTGLVEKMLESAAHLAPHEIAVVSLDRDFGTQALAAHLEDLLGEPVTGDLAAYNLAPETSLADRPLFCAALLPVRLAVNGQKRHDFFTLIRSAYYGTFSRWSRKLASWDLQWRNEQIDTGLDEMLRAIRQSAAEIFPEKGDEIGALLSPFISGTEKSATLWSEDLRRIWQRFEFPVIANELDRISWSSLDELLARFAREFGPAMLGVSEFSELLASAASRIRVQKTGLEDAGIQVLGRLDARGLDFAKVFIPGLVSGSLPQPARALPLLGQGELKKVLGGSPESQLDFGRYVFGNLCASAPEITLSRPAMSREGDICLPSPFWPVEFERKISPVIAWKDALPAMQRAEWVRRSISGIREKPEQAVSIDEKDFRMSPINFDEPVSVSALESALNCPARFFLRHFLRIEELPAIEAGIAPPEKGQKVHEILAAFVSRASAAMQSGEITFECLRRILEETVVEKLAPDLSGAVWQVELERLTGREDFPGLLLMWLEEEWKRIEEGWTWVSAECGFSGLELAGSSARIKGRLDRVDYHPGVGTICWDYKTGRVPSQREVREGTAPQLPAYLLAVKSGLIKGVGGGSSGAGYIDLGSPGKVKHMLVFNPREGEDAFLDNWQELLAGLLNRIASGEVPPRWLEKDESCDEYCPYRDICGAP